ncbi:MAG: DMT family transporter [Tetrasphaera sp.]
MSDTAVLTATQAYQARKIKLATSGMKIAILMPITAIVQNIFNVSVTEDVAATLAEKVLLSVIISITLIGMADLFAGVFSFLYNASKGKGIPEYKRTAGLRISWMMLLAAAVAGPMATGLWMAATPFAGLTMVAVITSLGPVLTVIVSRFFLHENISPRVYLGITITVLGVIIAGWAEGETGSNFALGVMLALMAPIGFTLESQFSTYAGDMIDPNVGCGIYRCFGSGIIGLTAMTILSAATGHIEDFGSILNMVLTSPKLLLFVAIMGLLGAINYNAAYLAFNRTGPSRTLAIDSSRPVWSIPLGYLFSAMGVAAYSVTKFGIVGAIVVVLGLLLVISKPSELVNLRNVD